MSPETYQAHEEVAVDLTVVFFYPLLNLSLGQNWLVPVDLFILQKSR